MNYAFREERAKGKSNRGLPAVPCYLSSEASECGTVCLVMIGKYLGLRDEAYTLRQRFRASSQGVTLRGLIGIAEGMGLRCRPLRVDLGALRTLRFPVILHFDFDHFVVCLGFRGGLAVIHDPSFGARSIDEVELSSRFTGVCLEVALAPAVADPPKEQETGLRTLLRYSGGIAPTMGMLIAISLAIQIVALAVPITTQYVIDSVLPSGSTSMLLAAMVGLGCAALIQLVLELARYLSLAHACGEGAWRAESEVFRSLLHAAPEWLRRRDSAEVASSLTMIESMVRQAGESVVDVILDPLMGLLALAVLYVYSPAVGMLTTAVVVTDIGLGLFAAQSMGRVSNDEVAARVRRAGFLQETIRAAPAIRLGGLGQHRSTLFMNLSGEYLGSALRRARWESALSMVSGVLWALNFAAVFWIVARELAQDSAAGVGAIVAVLGIRQAVQTKAEGIVRHIQTMLSVRAMWTRVEDVVRVQPEDDQHDAFQARPADLFPLVLRGVRFAHGVGGPTILDGLDLEVRKGEMVAIVAPSGAGKSTLLRLIVGLERPQEGDVRFGYLGAGAPHIGAFRRLMSVVLQDDTVFSGSITDNITLFDPDADPADVEAAAAAAMLHDDIERMPLRYLTPVGEAGGYLSGGQRQRLLIARALFRKPALLILDEATAGVDAASEAGVIRNIKRGGVTCLVAAHREAWIASADRVLRLENGRLKPA